MNLLHIDISSDIEGDLATVPTAPAAISVHAADGRCMLLAISGDARSFCRNRLVGSGPQSLSGVATSIRLAPRPSMLEAELAWLELTRSTLGPASRSMLDRMRCWFLSLDRAGHWTVTQLENGLNADEMETTLGPITTKHAAERLGHVLDAAFDLCRFPAELKKAPAGRACMYHDMGRCPAPCAGLETLASFHARFAAAARAACSMESLRTVLTDRMQDAAAATHFERARELRELLDGLEGSRGRSTAHAAALDTFARVIVSPASSSCQRVWFWTINGLECVVDIERGAPDTTLEALAATLASRRFAPEPVSRVRIEEFWMLARRLFASRRAESFLTLAEASDPTILASAMRRRAKISAPPDETTLL